VRDLAVLFLHLLATIARLAGPGGARAVVAESVLVKHQLLIVNRSRKRSPNLRASDRVVAGLCALFMRPGRLDRMLEQRSAAILAEDRAEARAVTGSFGRVLRARQAIRHGHPAQRCQRLPTRTTHGQRTAVRSRVGMCGVVARSTF
jgi:hypothetical protein